MTAHLDDADLYAMADGATDREHERHVATCASCGTRYRRLAAGAALIRATRRESAPPIDWHKLDPRIAEAAEESAAAIRAGTLRAARTRPFWVYGGVALAAAAASVLVLRTTPSGSSQAHPVVAQRHVAPSDVTPSAPEAPAVGFEGIVLMVAAPVTYAAADATPVPLTGATRVHEGGRVASDDHGGRVILGLHSGYRLDVRSGGEVTLARLSTRETRFALTKGEIRLEGPALTDEAVSLQASGWTLRSKGGAFVAKVEGDHVRVRVVSGKVGVSHEGFVERDVMAGDEVTLALADGVQLVSHDAHDVDALDSSLVAEDGRLVEIPALAGVAAMSVPGHGVLPAGTTTMRVAGPIVVQAQAGTESWTLGLDGSAATWRRAPRTVVASAAHAASATHAEPSVVEAPAAPVNYVMRPTHGDDRGRIEGRFAPLAQGCLAVCQTGTNCAGLDDIELAIEHGAGGRVESVRVTSHGGTPTIEQCVQRVATTALTLPAEAEVVGAVQLRLTVHAEH